MSCPVSVRPSRSEHVDLFGLRSLGALTGGELDPLVFPQAAETDGLDGGVVKRHQPAFLAEAEQRTRDG
jgi:hypothetical protein